MHLCLQLRTGDLAEQRTLIEEQVERSMEQRQKCAVCIISFFRCFVVSLSKLKHWANLCKIVHWIHPASYHTWYWGIETHGHCCVSVQKYSDKYWFINCISSMPFMTQHLLNDISFINFYGKVDVANKTILVIGSQNPWLEVVLLARSFLFCFVLIEL